MSQGKTLGRLPDPLDSNPEVAMTKTEVLALLKANKNERGIANWKKLGAKFQGLKSFGIGLTQLRKLAKQIGKDHSLALKLWASDYYDARVIGLLIDDPKEITREQIEEQVDQLGPGELTHVFASCGATLAKTPFSFDLTNEWLKRKDPTRRKCAYGLLYESSKSNTKSAPDEAYFLKQIAAIDQTIEKEPVDIQMAMSGALMGIGKRTKKLNAAALKVARKVNPIDFDPDGTCDPFDVVKHLVSPYLKEKLGIK